MTLVRMVIPLIETLLAYCFNRKKVMRCFLSVHFFTKLIRFFLSFISLKHIQLPIDQHKGFWLK